MYKEEILRKLVKLGGDCGFIDCSVDCPIESNCSGDTDADTLRKAKKLLLEIRENKLERIMKNEWNTVKEMQDFYVLVQENFGNFEITWIDDGCYEENPQLIIYPLSYSEIDAPSSNGYRLDIYCGIDGMYSIHGGLENHKSYRVELDASQYLIYKLIKEVLVEVGIEKELYPETRYEETFPKHIRN